jgi:hypothetical protein
VSTEESVKRKQHQISQLYRKRISIYVSMSIKTVVASVCMQKGGSQVRFYTHTLQYRNFLILPHIIHVAPFHITDRQDYTWGYRTNRTNPKHKPIRQVNLLTPSSNRTQSRAVIGLLTGHNTLRRHLHLLGLLDTPLCSGCGVKEETLAHILCKCEALASLKYVYLGSFFLEPEDIKSINLGAIWNFSKVTGLP